MERSLSFSVVIPTYNGSAYIDGLLANFRNQKGKFNLIFVNDGSTDDTQEKLEQAKKNEAFPIEVIYQKNSGVSVARNTGMDHATGDYLMFCDVDDAVSPEIFKILEKQIVKSSRDDIPYCHRISRVREDQLINGTYQPPRSDSEVVTTIESREEYLLRLLKNPTMNHCNLFVLPKNLYQNPNMRFSVGYKYYEDYDFIYRLLMNSAEIADIHAELYFYIQRTGSAVNQFRIERIENLELIRNWESEIERTAPSILKPYRQWAISRLIWSLTWQGATIFSKHDFKQFISDIKSRQNLQKLKDYPDKRVRLSSKVFLFSPRLFQIVIRTLAKRHTKLTEQSWDEVKGKAKNAEIFS